MLKIVIIGDTHTRHQELSVPDGDVLCHIGDFTDFGEGSDDFFDWLSRLPHPEKLVILGNHEVFTESESIDFNKSLQAGVKILLNESIQIEHIVFTGIVAVTPFYLSERWPRNHSTNVLF